MGMQGWTRRLSKEVILSQFQIIRGLVRHRVPRCLTRLQTICFCSYVLCPTLLYDQYLSYCGSEGFGKNCKFNKVYWTPYIIVVLLISPFLHFGVKYTFNNSQNMKEQMNVLRWFARHGQSRNLSDEITVVTAYWNLGRFQKGGGNSHFDTPLYHTWANTFRYLMNPLVVYTDSDEFAQLINSLRNSTVHRTKLFIISRNSSWAFRNVDRIRQIYSSKGYPKHHPNTVVPEYACAQHAKYDVTARAARDNLYRTNYFAWLDVGYFRNRDSSTQFQLIKPNDFNESLIAMNEVHRKRSSSVRDIFRRNIVWVGGGLFLGQRDVILAHEAEFKRAVDYFLAQNVMNTDQQVLNAMYSKEGLQQLQPTTTLQVYWSNGDWFYLGKSMVKEMNH